MTEPFTTTAQPIAPNVITAPRNIDQPIIPTLNDFLAMARSRNFSRTDRFLVHFNLPAGLADEFGSDITDLTLMCEEAAFPGKTITPRPLRINGMTENRAHTVDYMGDSITFQFLVDSTWLPRRVMERWMQLCVDGPESSREVGFYQDYISTINIYALVPATPELEGVSRSSTPADRGARTGLGTSDSVLRNIINRTKRAVDDQLDKAKTKVTSFIDPKATDLLKNAERILNIYKGGTDPNADIPAEKAVWGMQLFEAWPRVINVQQVAYGNHGFHKLNVTFTYKYWKSDVVTDLANVKSEPQRTSLLDRLSIDRLFPRRPSRNG